MEIKMLRIKAFRIGNKRGFANKDIQIQLSKAAGPIFVPGGADLKTLPLVNIEREEFGALNEDALKAAFAVCVDAIQAYEAFPRALSLEQQIANGAVGKHASEILTTFGARTRSVTAIKYGYGS
jgi:hypothetical protein